MYKIYINETGLILTSKIEKCATLNLEDNCLMINCPIKKKYMLNYIDMLEKTDRWDYVFWKTDDVENQFEKLKSLYKLIIAGGAIVQNKKGEILFIYRFKKWDLPKGKNEHGETILETAFREISEETGISNLKNLGFLEKTYHTYKSKKGKRILKETHWFHFITQDEELIAQSEEGIEDIIWINPSDLSTYLNHSYPNIVNLVNRFILQEEK